VGDWAAAIREAEAALPSFPMKAATAWGTTRVSQVKVKGTREQTKENKWKRPIFRPHPSPDILSQER
jgi:hypothetical protein